MPGLRETIAHAATPWEWKSKAAVQGLVLLCIAMFALSIAWPFIDGEFEEKSAPLQACLYGVLGFALFLWPGVRAWRRWRSIHPES